MNMLTTLVAVALAAEPIGPNAELRAALADLETCVPPALRRATRYLTFYNLPADERRDAGAALSLVLNSVSRAETIVRPTAVPGTDGRLWRIALDDYGLPADVWERLASRDPYWHVQTNVAVGATLATQPVYTDGGWLDLAAAARLRELSGSGGALLRGDYFLARASTTLDDGVYYELAGVAATEDEFFRSLGLDVAAIDRLRADEGANVIRSRVTFKPRRIVRRQGPLGGAWHTYDTARATPERDPLRNPFDFTYDAGEHIAARRNGLFVFALFDAAGRRQASVPDVVAKDTSDPHGAGIVQPLLSCVRCHVEDGLRPTANDQRRLLSAGVELFAEADEARRLAAFYFTDLEKRMRRDREDYADAVAAATGGAASAEVAAGLAGLVGRYADELVDAERAAAEVGVSREALVAALRSSHDVALAALSVGVAVDRKQWEAAFAEAAVLCAAKERKGHKETEGD